MAQNSPSIISIETTDMALVDQCRTMMGNRIDWLGRKWAVGQIIMHGGKDSFLARIELVEQV